MKRQNNMLLVLSSGGMMLSCFYACESFVLASISHKPIPLSQTGIVLFMAVLITAVHNRRGWPRIYVIGLHILGSLFASLQLLHDYYSLEFSLWSLHWGQEFILQERTAASWWILILILVGVWILWFCGIRLITKPTDQTTLSHRFDLGLAFLLFLLLIKLLMAVKESSIPIEHSSTKSLLSYIVLGLFSMGLVRIKSAAETGDVTYFKGAGIVLSFVVITFLLGGGLFILFLPGLQILAKASYGLLISVTKPLERFVIFLSDIFFEMGIRRKFGEEPTGEPLPSINRSGGELGILDYLFIGSTITILLAMAGFILHRLIKVFISKVKWLFSKTVEERDKMGIWELILAGTLAAKRFLAALWTNIFYTSDTANAVEKFYKRLLRWSRFSGMRHIVSETPMEFGIRLTSRFPRIQKEIGLIILLHDEAVYGGIRPDRHQILHARLALRRIRNPLLWWARIKSLCFHNRF